MFLAWILGFFQAMTGFFIETMIAFYISGISSMMDIILKFAAMTAVVAFDNMYADALLDEKMKAAAGKKLPIEYKSYMGDNFDQAAI